MSSHQSDNETQQEPSADGRRRLVTFVLFVGIVALGIVLFSVFLATRPEPKRQSEETKAVVVDVVAVTQESRPVVVTAMGRVVPARSVTVYPEVSGKLIYQSPKLVPGGRFSAGQALVQIDPRDYDLAVRQQQAAVSQAEMALAQERSRKAVADREWSLVGDTMQPTEQGRQLALREIQLENARAGVDAARSLLEKAVLQRSRTTVRAPFNSIVQEELVDVGQVVSSATRIATLVDSDRFWVRTTVPTDRLAWIRIPGVNAENGSPARVVVNLGGGETIEHQGVIVQLLSDLDPKGMMARVLVEVEHPWEALSEAGLPLLLGSFATVYIEGTTLEQVTSVPRTALHDNRTVWVMGDDKTLQMRDVEVLWSEAETVFVEGDIEPGDRAIVSRIAVPVQGMAVRTNGNGHDSSDGSTRSALKEENDETALPRPAGDADSASEEKPL